MDKCRGSIVIEGRHIETLTVPYVTSGIILQQMYTFINKRVIHPKESIALSQSLSAQEQA